MVLSHDHRLLPDLQYLKLANTAAAPTLICTSIKDGGNLQTELGRPKQVINCKTKILRHNLGQIESHTASIVSQWKRILNVISPWNHNLSHWFFSGVQWRRAANELKTDGRYARSVFLTTFSWSFIHLDVPKITRKPPSSFTANEGSRVSFSCESVGFPKPDITWYKDNERMNSRHFNKEKGEITFSSVQFSDRGSYRCEARNFLGVDSVTIEVAVEGMQTS